MPKTSKRTVVAAAVGNVLQWYDFGVFGFLAPVISTQIFPADDPIAGLLKTFGIFAIGYLAQPVGGVLFGHLGDRIGRRRALQVSVIAMAIPTTLISILPTQAQVGVWAAVVLVLLRLAQGICAGGEIIGSVCYLVELAPPGKRGLYGSYTLCFAIGGLLVGSAVAAILHIVMSSEAIAQWGWRLPFLGGVVLGFVGWRLRRGLLETPAFREILDRDATVAHPALQAIREMPLQILLVGIIVIILSVAMNILFIWMPTYLTHIVKPPVAHALLINTLAMILLIALVPLSGMLSDRFGFKRVLAWVMIATAILVYPLFTWIDTGTLIAVVIALAAFAVIVGFLQGGIPIALAAQFPVELRYSGMAVGFNISVAIFGGTAPLIATWLIKDTGTLAAPAWYIAAAAVLSCAATLCLKGRYARTDKP